jgi:hypothetical protein
MKDLFVFALFSPHLPALAKKLNRNAERITLGLFAEKTPCCSLVQNHTDCPLALVENLFDLPTFLGFPALVGWLTCCISRKKN